LALDISRRQEPEARRLPSVFDKAESTVAGTTASVACAIATSRVPQPHVSMPVGD
jgi:hypothetical protein